MKLLGAVSHGSGAINEDGYGVIEEDGLVSAAWVFDGVTGINGCNHLDAGSDAQWLVQKAHTQLLDLAARDIALPELLEALVSRLIADWNAAQHSIEFIAQYDPPASCLVLAKRYGRSWKALRLGDSCLLARYRGGEHRVYAASPNNHLDHWLSNEAKKRRDAGVSDEKTLLATFRAQLLEGRAKRNQPNGYSILECSLATLAMPEYLDLGTPASLLLCTDGYYRAVDHYRLHDGAGLLSASEMGVKSVLDSVRAIEAADPDCQRYPRFKPADDATAVMLSGCKDGTI